MPNAQRWKLYVQQLTDRKPKLITDDAAKWEWYITLNGVRHHMITVDTIAHTATYAVDPFKVRDVGAIPSYIVE